MNGHRASPEGDGPGISVAAPSPNGLEWEPLLTTILFDPRENRRVEVDLMAADGHLYRGTVEDHFLDKEGGLRGLLLKDADASATAAPRDTSLLPARWLNGTRRRKCLALPAAIVYWLVCDLDGPILGRCFRLRAHLLVHLAHRGDEAR